MKSKPTALPPLQSSRTSESPLSLVLLSVYLFLLPIMGGHLEDPRNATYPYENLELAALRLLLLGIAALRFYESRQPGGRPWQPKPSWPTLLFVAWNLVTAFTGASFLVSFDSLWFLGTLALTYLMVSDACAHPHGRMWLFGGVMAGAGLTGAWGLREYVRTVRESGDTSWRVFSFFAGPNLLASYLLPCLFLGLTGVLLGQRPWLVAICAATLLSAIGLVLTGSRGAILALAGALVVWLALSFLNWNAGDRVASRSRMVRLAAIVIVGLAFGAYFMKPTAARVGSSASAGESNSTEFRKLTWKGTVSLIRERPVAGWGPGLWETAYSRVAQAGYTKTAHNGYLQVAAETGVIGLLLWLLVLGYGLGGRKRGDRMEAGRTAALVALMLHNGVDYGWLLYAPASLTWGLLAARPSASVSEDRAEMSSSVALASQPKIQNPKSKILTPLAVALSLLSLLPAYGEWKAIQGEAALATGNVAQAQQDYSAASSMDFVEPQWPRRLAEIQRELRDPKAAAAFYEEAVRRDPLRAANHYRLALAYAAANEAEKSEAALRQSLKLDPNSVPALMRLGEMEESRGHHEAAMEQYRKVVEIQEGPVGKVTALAEMENPDYAAARYLLAKDALEHGDRAVALQHAQAGIETADRYLNGMTTTWKKVLEASGQPVEDLDRKIQNAQDLKTRLEAIRRQAEMR